MPPQAAARVYLPDPLLVLDAMEDPRRWFGSDGAAARDRLLLTSLAAAYGEVSRRLGPDPAAWTWGALQRLTFTHPAGGQVGPVPRGGSWHTVDASSYLLFSYQPISGPSFKMVLDVGRWDRSLAVNAPGQSGDPASPHHRDLLPLWQKREYFPLLYSRAAVERHTVQRFLLLPAAGRTP
jgi:penicillin amidase